MAEKKRVVFLIGGYWPTFAPPGVCAEKIVAHIADRCDVTVICWGRGTEIKAREYEHDGVRVIQVSDFLNDRLVAAGSPAARRFWRGVRLGVSALRLEGTVAWVRSVSRACRCSPSPKRAFEAVRAIAGNSSDRSAVWSVNTEKEYHEGK